VSLDRLFVCSMDFWRGGTSEECGLSGAGGFYHPQLPLLCVPPKDICRDAVKDCSPWLGPFFVHGAPPPLPTALVGVVCAVFLFRGSKFFNLSFPVFNPWGSSWTRYKIRLVVVFFF